MKKYIHVLKVNGKFHTIFFSLKDLEEYEDQYLQEHNVGSFLLQSVQIEIASSPNKDIKFVYCVLVNMNLVEIWSTNEAAEQVAKYLRDNYDYYTVDVRRMLLDSRKKVKEGIKK